MGKHKTAPLRKAPGNAFDTALGLSDEQLADLHLWCRRSYQHAANQAAEQWNVKLSISQLCRWFHRDDKLTLLKTLGSSAALATEIVSATEKDQHDPLLACERAISAMAMKALGGEITSEEMELALELFRTATASRAARDRAKLEQQKLDLARESEARAKEQLKLDREKFIASMKPKLDLAMDEFATLLKGNPDLLAEFNSNFRPKIHAAAT